jgi:predicted N-formylglutamate amidohydrolase
VTYKKVIIGTVSKTIVSLDVGVFLVSRLLSLNIDRLLILLHFDVALYDVNVRLF